MGRTALADKYRESVRCRIDLKMEDWTELRIFANGEGVSESEVIARIVTGYMKAVREDRAGPPLDFMLRGGRRPVRVWELDESGKERPIE